jgi:hypothetical protein
MKYAQFPVGTVFLVDILSILSMEYKKNISRIEAYQPNNTHTKQSQIEYQTVGCGHGVLIQGRKVEEHKAYTNYLIYI